MANLVVTVAVDENDGNKSPNDLSLREAIILANARPGEDTITFSSKLKGQTIKLTLGELSVTSDLKINGDSNRDGEADITISGNNASRIFDISTRQWRGVTDVDLNYLVLTNGSSGEGGAIRATGGSHLEILNTTIKDSHTTGSGGGIFVDGVLSTRNVTIYHNGAWREGGGVYVNGSATLLNTTIDSNESGDGGGGIATGFSGRLTIDNCTITRNIAGMEGGGIRSGNPTFVSDSIIAQNTDMWGFGTPWSDLRIEYDAGPGQIRHSFIGAENDYIYATGGTINGGGDPKLGELRDNGGPVDTRALLPGSPAIGMGTRPHRGGEHSGPNHSQPAHASADNLDAGSHRLAGISEPSAGGRSEQDVRGMGHDSFVFSFGGVGLDLGHRDAVTDFENRSSVPHSYNDGESISASLDLPHLAPGVANMMDIFGDQFVFKGHANDFF